MNVKKILSFSPRKLVIAILAIALIIVASNSFDAWPKHKKERPYIIGSVVCEVLEFNDESMLVQDGSSPPVIVEVVIPPGPPLSFERHSHVMVAVRATNIDGDEYFDTPPEFLYLVWGTVPCQHLPITMEEKKELSGWGGRSGTIASH